MEFDGIEYLVGTDDEATEYAREQIEQSLWAFNASFLASWLKCPEESVKAVQDNEKCEGNNETFATWLEEVNGESWLEDFADDAISADGRGHFVSNYDGNEHEFTLDGTTFYAYRV